ncbi:RNA methyltransferase, RsmD family [Halobacteroides halobius DSM 5150]|uniref:RNA methyltransferase, RsmD family n=1 Tax=Halobacteroides halobius (strain ATCC 35273 / DSM 5150 / MD-1) TaxID=748449 RepID=L0K807_HALHC|nr:16S rRNA (guanine(966)-N(2))-methyltransferase RsmD [Halobacteroides halobius]AGB41156.1 RNA methyltransferase, RsmD family [Halobacteroides halobius DSM 5150]
MRIIAGKNKGKRLKSLDRRDVRPTSDRTKEALFNILGPDVVGTRCLDLYAGFGGLGIEAISRGANEVTFIEQNKQIAKTIDQNIASVSYQDQSKVIVDDVLKALRRLRGHFELIFMDPPYKEIELYTKTLDRISQYNLLHPTGIIIVEHQAKADLDWPADYVVIKERNYGKSTLTLLRGASDNG